jgi:hypothetical protein
MIRQGWLMSLFHASQQWSTMSWKDLKIRFDSQLSRKNCQMFSCGFSSGHFAGNGNLDDTRRGHGSHPNGA